MRTFVRPPANMSKAMKRVADALERFAPHGVECVRRERDAQLVVIHAIGTCAINHATKLTSHGKRFAIIQYCLRTTQQPDTQAWVDTWRRSVGVWSYYDLVRACHEDRTTLPLGLERRMLLAPLGVDEAFRASDERGPSKFIILTSGYVAETECVSECWAAARAVGRRVFHLGPPRQFTDHDTRHVTFGHGIDDGALAMAYRASDFVAGMRRVEGFELPAAEGLLCGARSVMLNRRHYRDWFGAWAEYVDEAEPDVVTRQLVELFERERRPVGDEAITAARERFDWGAIARRFWERVLA